jgi:uncharacterized protein YhbP (UPF0306 family)
MNREELEKTVIRYKDSFTTMTLACTDEGGAWTARVYYARVRLDLYFFSSTDSRHAKALERDPRAAASIYGLYTGWKEIQGLQMEGAAGTVEGALEQGRGLAAYLARYPFAKEFLPRPRELTDMMKKSGRISLYVFRPERILYLNNEAGFGTRWMLKVENGRAAADPVPA